MIIKDGSDYYNLNNAIRFTISPGGVRIYFPITEIEKSKHEESVFISQDKSCCNEIIDFLLQTKVVDLRTPPKEFTTR